jgi:hypothetical protein
MRIREVTIKQFRGIPAELTLSFLAPSRGTPQSLILIGDNGSGKSSVVDAIEFALQGRIRRTKTLVAPLVPNSHALNRDGQPSVEVQLTDGKAIRRRLFRDDGGNWSVGGQPPPRAFSYAPFVLRRADILLFLSTPEAQRQLIFSDYRLGSSIPKEDDQEFQELPGHALIVAEEQRLQEKIRRRRIASLIANVLSISEDDVPPNSKYFDVFVNERFFGGISASEAKKRKIVRPILNKATTSLIVEYRACLAEISRLGTEISKMKNLHKNPSDFHNKLRGVVEVLEDVAIRITELFLEVSNADFVERVSLTCGDTALTSARVELVLGNGIKCKPEQVLSEANLDLLSVLIFLAFAESAATRGQAKVLVLDDVFQSVDSAIRVAVADLILRRFSDWQLIFTVHDRLWHEQLRQLFRQRGLRVLDKEIVRWSFDGGPVVRDAAIQPDRPLLEAIDNTDVARICSASGLLLEETCAQLSWALPISVQRKRGDKYELGDLWPGVFKVLRKSTISSTAESVDRWLHLRNAVGAHFNEWARSVSLGEARSFGEAVVELLWSVRCDNCYRWIEATSDRTWCCRCGQVHLEIAKT